MSVSDWREISGVLGRDAGPGVRKKAKMNKAQRLAKAAKSRKTKAKGRAALHMLRVMNPAGAKKVGAVRVKRLKGGGVSIIPIKKVAVRR